MKCEKCNKNEATFFYEETVNGKSRSYHLCAECAKALRESGEIKLDFEEKTPFSLFEDFSPFPNLLGGIFGLPQGAPPKIGKTCPACGATWEDLAARGYEMKGTVSKNVTASKIAGAKWNSPDTYYTIRNKVIPGSRIDPAHIENGMCVWMKK